MGLFGLGKGKKTNLNESKPGDSKGGLEDKATSKDTKKDSGNQVYGTAYKAKSDGPEVIPSTTTTLGVDSGSSVNLYHMKYVNPSKSEGDIIEVRIIECPIGDVVGRRMLLTRKQLDDIAFKPSKENRDKPFPYDAEKLKALYNRVYSKK